MSQVGFRMVKLNFNAKPILDAVGRATRKVFMKFGSFVRTTARESIIKRKGISKPGKPPSSHVGSVKRLIFFRYDPDQRNVVIGPLVFPTRKTRTRPFGLAALEFGGRITRLGTGKLGPETFVLKARPFMGPAFEREKPKLSKMWRDSVI